MYLKGIKGTIFDFGRLKQVPRRRPSRDPQACPMGKGSLRYTGRELVGCPAAAGHEGRGAARPPNARHRGTRLPGKGGLHEALEQYDSMMR